jgi:hypothetical protein
VDEVGEGDVKKVGVKNTSCVSTLWVCTRMMRVARGEPAATGASEGPGEWARAWKEVWECFDG